METKKKQVEIRCFSFLKKITDEKKLPFPFYVDLEQECTALELADRLQLPRELIEGVFVNGLAQPIDTARIKTGDRIAFLPPGTPGPYRALLGIVKIEGELKE